MKALMFSILVLVFLSGCSMTSKMSELPDEDNVKTSRHKADKDCEELGKVRGTSTSLKGTAEQALADLKQEAANKGANYVEIKQYSDNKTSVTGLAYKCP